MKIGVLMNVYNEVEWLRCAINSVIDWCDEMVVVEGAYGIAIEAGAPPRSNDGTLEILEEYKNNAKFTLIHSNERDESPQLQKGLDILKEKGIDWYLLVDGDEIWQKKDLALIKNSMIRGEKSGIYQYRVHFYNFINSFDTYYDSVMKRVFKLTPGATAIGQNGLSWPDHNKIVDMGRNPPQQDHISILPNMCRCFHYTEIKSANRWLLKKSYLKIRDGNPIFDSWKVTKDGFINDAKDFKKFKMKHPDIIKDVELYKTWVNNPEDLRLKLFGDFDG